MRNKKKKTYPEKSLCISLLLSYISFSFPEVYMADQNFFSCHPAWQNWIEIELLGGPRENNAGCTLKKISYTTLIFKTPEAKWPQQCQDFSFFYLHILILRNVIK